MNATVLNATAESQPALVHVNVARAALVRTAAASSGACEPSHVQHELSSATTVSECPQPAPIDTQPPPGHVWYFAIGSMINPTSLRLRDLHPSTSLPATILDFRLQFVWRQGLPNAFADAQREPGCSFDGVLHLMTEGEMRALDGIEVSYDRTPAVCTTYTGQRVECVVYSFRPHKGEKETAWVVRIAEPYEGEGDWETVNVPATEPPARALAPVRSSDDPVTGTGAALTEGGEAAVQAWRAMGSGGRVATGTGAGTGTGLGRDTGRLSSSSGDVMDTSAHNAASPLPLPRPGSGGLTSTATATTTSTGTDGAASGTGTSLRATAPITSSGHGTDARPAPADGGGVRSIDDGGTVSRTQHDPAATVPVVRMVGYRGPDAKPPSQRYIELIISGCRHYGVRSVHMEALALVPVEPRKHSSAFRTLPMTCAQATGATKGEGTGSVAADAGRGAGTSAAVRGRAGDEEGKQNAREGMSDDNTRGTTTQTGAILAMGCPRMSLEEIRALNAACPPGRPLYGTVNGKVLKWVGGTDNAGTGNKGTGAAPDSGSSGTGTATINGATDASAAGNGERDVNATGTGTGNGETQGSDRYPLWKLVAAQLHIELVMCRVAFDVKYGHHDSIGEFSREHCAYIEDGVVGFVEEGWVQVVGTWDQPYADG